jgi:hypothetical protein
MAVVRVERSLRPLRVTRTPVPVGYHEHCLVLGRIQVVSDDQVRVRGQTLLGLPVIAGGTYTRAEIAANTMRWRLPCRAIAYKWQPPPSEL